MNHKRSKCMFFHHGMVLNKDCDKVIARCFCDIDEMEDDKPCTADACYYYVRANKDSRVAKKEKTDGV